MTEGSPQDWLFGDAERTQLLEAQRRRIQAECDAAAAAGSGSVFVDAAGRIRPVPALRAEPAPRPRPAAAADDRPLPWAGAFGRRCRARLAPTEDVEFWGRCDLAPHPPQLEHALERGMIVVRWSTSVRWDGP